VGGVEGRLARRGLPVMVPVEHDQAEREGVARDGAQVGALVEQDALQALGLAGAAAQRLGDLALGEGAHIELGMALLAQARAPVVARGDDAAGTWRAAQVGDQHRRDLLEQRGALVGIEHAGDLVEAVEQEEDVAAVAQPIEVLVEEGLAAVRQPIAQVAADECGQLVGRRRRGGAPAAVRGPLLEVDVDRDALVDALGREQVGAALAQRNALAGARARR
jgi:hypothetical protein